MVQLLVMEAKRLNLEDRSLGIGHLTTICSFADNAEATTVEAEIDFVMDCMHRKAGAHPFAGLQASGLEDWRTRAPSEERVPTAV